MKVRTYLSPAEVDPAHLSGTVAAVIDVIRATSTMVEALAAGARAIYPTVSTEEAIRLANSFGREDTLLCGERKGLKVDGFDFGNSPREFSPGAVEDKRLVMSTTNGTRAFLAAEDAERVVAVSLMNLSAAVRAISGAESLAIVCAGRENRFSLDDALCAGLLVQRLSQGRGEAGDSSEAGDASSELVLDDASRAVLALSHSFQPTVEFLRATAAGAALVKVGLEEDLTDCAEVDRHQFVPEMHDRTIRLPREV